MKTLFLVLISSFYLFSTGLCQSGSGITISGKPVYDNPDSNYAKFAEQNFNYLKQDTSQYGKKQLKYFNRDYYFWKTRLGSTSSAGNTEEYMNAIAALKSYPCAFVDSANWNCVGPQNHKHLVSVGYRRIQAAGRIDAVYMDTGNINNILIGTHSSGIWKTINKGKDWINVTDHIRIPSLGITSFTIDPSNKGHILAFGGKVHSQVNHTDYGPIMLESYDTGTTWNEVNIQSPAFYSSSNGIAKGMFNPFNANEIWVLQKGPQGGLFKSTNGGISFDTLFNMKDKNALPLGIGNPMVNQRQGGIDFEFLSASNIVIGGVGGNGGTSQSFISRDAGNTWSDLFDSSSVFHSYTHGKIISGMKISTPILGVTYYGIINVSANKIQIFKSRNYGVNFYFFAELNLNEQKPGKFEIEPSTLNVNQLHIGGVRYKWYDSITNSFLIREANGITSTYHSDIRAMQIINSSIGQEKIVVGNDGGLSLFDYTNPSSPIKESLNGDNFPITQLYRLGISQYGNGFKIISGGIDNGTYGLRQDTIGWNRIGASDGGFSWLSYDSKNLVLDELAWQTHRQNLSWSSGNIIINTNYLSSSLPDHYYIDKPLSIIKNGKTTFYAANKVQQLGKNSNFSNSFSNTRQSIDSMKFLGTISTDEYNDSLIWLAEDQPFPAKNGKLYKSTDGGVNYHNITDKIVSFNGGSDKILNLLDWKSITDIEINPKNNNEVYLSIAGVYDSKSDIYGKADSVKKQIRIIRSVDGGETWADWSKGLPKPRIPVNDLIFHKQSDGLVFCATDMGVYYRNNLSNEWKCFQNGLPPTIVTEMQVNYCENKIYASTFGRSIWSSDIPSSLVANGEREITANTLIDYTMFTPYDIRVKNGAILTLTDTLIFSKGRKLIVEPGARLVINGGAVTGRCGEFWDGIFVAGNSTLDQTPPNQGSVHLNSALVENAKRGISTRDPNTWGSHGGIIKATNSTFRNNSRDIEFLPYHNIYVSSTGIETGNRSEFTNCKFILDDNYISGVEDNRMSMWDVNGVRISGCDFEDNRNPTPVLIGLARSTGIFTLDATCHVDEVCSSASIPCTSAKRSTFRNLSRGIHSIGSSPIKKINVENTDFINNTNGIVLEGTRSARIVNNIFSSNTLNSIGIYLMSSNDYQVEGNQFISTMTAGPFNRSIGTLVYNKHGNDTKIYRNEYHNMKEGIEAIGQNKEKKGLTEEYGLILKCNEFVGSNAEDLYVRNGPITASSPVFVGIKKYQGVPGGSNQELAGNLFSNSNSSNLWIKNKVEHFTYSHHNEVTTPRVKPANWTMPTILMNGSFTDYDNNSSCPDSTNQGGTSLGSLIALIQLNKNSEDSAVSVLQSLIDGGNTEVLVTQVTTTNNSTAYQHYLAIMSETGYVSEEVLEEVAAKENGFTLAMIRDILVANSHSASSEDIQQILDDRINELPAFMRIQILAGLNQVSPLEYMTRIISKYSTRKNEAIRRGLQIVRNDSNATLEDFESLLMETGNPYYTLEMVAIYDALGEKELANSLLLAMNNPDNFSESFIDYFNDFKTLRSLMQNWEYESLAELDETQLQAIQGFEETNNPTSATARKLLLLNNKTIADRPYYFSEDDTESEREKQRIFSVDGIQQSEFTVFPNPTKNFVTLSYSILETGGNRQLIIVSKLGKIVKTQLLLNAKDQLVVKLNNLSAGDYVCFVIVNGKSIGSKKITVIK